MNANQGTASASVAVNPLSLRAGDEFDQLNPIITNRDMIVSGVKQLKDIESSLQTNVDAYVATNGGEEQVGEEVKEGQHEGLSVARFKLELVRETIKRFEDRLAIGQAKVDEFVKV